MNKFKYESTIIDYCIIGKGVPILFLHGWGMDKQLMIGCFEPIFQKEDGFRRIYLDLPGMGRSVAGEVRSSDDIVDVLYHFWEEVIGEKFILAGESYGGYLTRGFIHKYSQLVVGTILLCPLMKPGYRMGQVEELQVMERDEDFLQTLTKDEYDSFTYMNVILTSPVWERFKTDIFPALIAQDRKFLDEILEGSFSFEVDDKIDDIEGPFQAPCLILTGKQDAEVGYKDQFDLLDLYPNASYFVLNRAGHNLQIEQSHQFELIVKGWIRDSNFIN